MVCCAWAHRDVQPHLAGKRMKLPPADTWEKRLSAAPTLAKKQAAWESLVAERKLPPVALLRNVRNLVEKRVSPATHRAACDQLLHHATRSSRTPVFPMHYVRAWTSLQRLGQVETWEALLNTAEPAAVSSRKRRRRGRRGRDPQKRGGGGEGGGDREEKGEEGAQPPPVPTLHQLAQRAAQQAQMAVGMYSEALNACLATLAHKRSPFYVPGHTIIVVDAQLYPVRATQTRRRSRGRTPVPVHTLQREALHRRLLMAAMLERCCETARVAVWGRHEPGPGGQPNEVRAPQQPLMYRWAPPRAENDAPQDGLSVLQRVEQLLVPKARTGFAVCEILERELLDPARAAHLDRVVVLSPRLLAQHSLDDGPSTPAPFRGFQKHVRKVCSFMWRRASCLLDVLCGGGGGGGGGGVGARSHGTPGHSWAGDCATPHAPHAATEPTISTCGHRHKWFGPCSLRRPGITLGVWRRCGAFDFACAVPRGHC